MRPSVCPYNESYWIYLALIYLPIYLPTFLSSLSLFPCNLTCLVLFTSFNLFYSMNLIWFWSNFSNQSRYLTSCSCTKAMMTIFGFLYWMIWFIKQVECFYNIVVSGIMWYKHIAHFYGFALDCPVPKPSSQGALRHARWHGWSDRSDATLGQRRDVWSLEPNQLSSDQHPDYLLYTTIILPMIYTRFIISHFIRIPINQSVPYNGM